jgi:hypothetical protein
VFLSKSQVAAALWDYGEDELAARAIQMSEDELKAIEGTRRRPAKDRPGVYEPLAPAPSRMD